MNTCAECRHATPTNRQFAPHYRWGVGCDGWRLHEDDELGVIEELVPAGQAEVPHRHSACSQVFVILSGTACMRLTERDIGLAAGDSLHIPAGVMHQFRNDGSAPVRFLVITAPRRAWDRINEPASGGEPWASIPEDDAEAQGRDRSQDRAHLPSHVALETTTRSEDIVSLHRQEIAEVRNACDLTHAEIHNRWDQIPSRWFIVARSNKPIGFIAIQDQCGGGYISDLFVIAAARRLGLGGRLVQAVIAQRPSQRLWLRVDPGNVAARRLYERFGFREQRDDAGMIVMERQP